MLWKKHTHTLGNIWHRQGSRSLELIYFFLSLSPSVALSFLLTISLFMSLSPSCFVSAKFRNKKKFAVAIFCILKCGLYSYVCVHWIFTCKPKMQRWPAATPASALLPSSSTSSPLFLLSHCSPSSSCCRHLLIAQPKHRPKGPRKVFSVKLLLEHCWRASLLPPSSVQHFGLLKKIWGNYNNNNNKIQVEFSFEELLPALHRPAPPPFGVFSCSLLLPPTAFQ